MTRLTSEHLAELRKVATADLLTSGTWRQTGVEGSPWNDVVTADHPTNPAWAEGVAETDTNDENAAFIAAFDPPTVLELLDELERLRVVVDQVEAYAREREAYGKRARTVYSSRVAADLLVIVEEA